MNRPYFLAIDNGTQSIRALVFDLEGNLVSKSKVDIEPYFSNYPGWAEQQPDYFWNKLCEACQQLWPQLKSGRNHIKAVALTTQRATVVNLDKQGNPLRPSISWLDQRQSAHPPNVAGTWKYLIKAAGGATALDYYRAQAECNWIAENQPQIWQDTDKFLLLSGYHTFKLTGQYVDSIASQVGYLPFDFKRFRWANAMDWKWQALTVRRHQLPKLVAPGQLLGSIQASAADQTGIPRGLLLIAAGADKACETLGSGCLQSDVASLSYGTTATINVLSKKYLEAIPLLPPYPAAIPNTYNAEIIVPRGYWMVEWFKQNFALLEQQLAQQQQVPVESLFQQFLLQTPPGAMGLTLQPYWSPGVREPGLEAKGAIIGFGDVHTKAHFYRAIIEGITYALRQGKEKIEKRSGTPIRKLVVSGGGSQCDQIMQITADIFGMTVHRPHIYETSGLGAAINAAVGTGYHPEHSTAIARMTRTGSTFHANSDNHRLYNELYSQVYHSMYERLAPLYHAIRKITGYPR